MNANNQAVINATTFPLTAYTPVITAASSAPSTGSGLNAGGRGQYQDFQGFVTGCFIVEFWNPGVAVGSGEYGVSLPFPVDGSFHTVGTNLNDSSGALSIIGEGYVLDISAVATSGSVALDAVTVAGVSYVRMLTEAFTSPAKTARVVRDSMPFALSDGDCVSGQFYYKRI
jgi:hypothetical protein